MIDIISSNEPVLTILRAIQLYFMIKMLSFVITSSTSIFHAAKTLCPRLSTHERFSQEIFNVVFSF